MGYTGKYYYEFLNNSFKEIDSIYTNEDAIDPTYEAEADEIVEELFYEVNDKKVSKSEFDKIEKKYAQYKFEFIGNSLTKINIDKLLK